MERFIGNGRYHEAIIHNGVLHLSGQTATEAGNDIIGQSVATLRKVEDLLKRLGSDRAHILHADVYLREQEDVAAFNAVWEQWVEKGKEPTRACMVTRLGRTPILVEVVVVAAMREDAPKR